MNLTKRTLYVTGMHCASCELFIERALRNIKGVKKVTASLNSNSIYIESEGGISLDRLNKALKGSNYQLSDKKQDSSKIKDSQDSSSNSSTLFYIAFALVLLIIIFGRKNLLSAVNISSTSSLPLIFMFGVIAGFSSCAALTGSIVLSLSEKWNQAFSKSSSLSQRIKPHLMFNGGRLISYTLFGMFLGLVGQSFKISGVFTSFLIVLVSVVMIGLALQMIGFKPFRNFKISLPKKVTAKVSDDKNFKGVFAPFLAGFLTFLLPCGFTLIAEGTAILASDPIRSALIMLFFVLGTTLPLLLIGLFSVQLIGNTKLKETFSKVAGLIIILLAFYNINTQLNLTSYLKGSSNTDNGSTLSKNKNGNVQVIRTTYTYAKDISPSTFEVKKGAPVRFEVAVKDNGYGCMSTILVPGLFNKSQLLVKGKTLVMEFTPTKEGIYQITCAMGVPRGTITVK
jgi:uncharacterized protein